MKKILVPLLCLVFLVSGCTSMTTETIGVELHPQKVFPPTKEGMERFVIVLPHKERGEENGFKVELIPGKTMLTDGVNLMRIGTTVVPTQLKGWGYTYYEVTGSNVAMSTLMVVPEGSQKVERFVPGTSLHIRYNSRLPVVIYVPKGHEIQYRIWNAGESQKAVKK